MSSTPAPSDAALVALAREGDEAAFGELVRRYMRSAYSVARSVTGSHEDAEDAAQESFMVALQRLDDCRSPERFGAWLITIVRNRSRNLVRRESLRQTDAIPLSARSSRPTPERDFEQLEVREELRRALEALPDVQRDVVLLHDYEGWKHREIADRLGIPSGTVRSHLHFARKALRAALNISNEANA